jgi:hypothetical protein
LRRGRPRSPPTGRIDGGDCSSIDAITHTFSSRLAISRRSLTQLLISIEPAIFPTFKGGESEIFPGGLRTAHAFTEIKGGIGGGQASESSRRAVHLESRKSFSDRRLRKGLTAKNLEVFATIDAFAMVLEPKTPSNSWISMRYSRVRIREGRTRRRGGDYRSSETPGRLNPPDAYQVIHAMGFGSSGSDLGTCVHQVQCPFSRCTRSGPGTAGHPSPCLFRCVPLNPPKSRVI